MTTTLDTTVSGQAPDTTEAERVLAWRELQLVRAGYDGPEAAMLAGCPHVDLHQAIALTKNGCEPKLAAEILR